MIMMCLSVATEVFLNTALGSKKKAKCIHAQSKGYYIIQLAIYIQNRIDVE